MQVAYGIRRGLRIVTAVGLLRLGLLGLLGYWIAGPQAGAQGFVRV